jgi:ribosomal protein L19E
VKYQPGCKHIATGTALIRRPLALLRELSAIAHEAYAELKRLNCGGEYRDVRALRSRRQRTDAFKAALAQRYREHNRCC